MGPALAVRVATVQTSGQNTQHVRVPPLLPRFVIQPEIGQNARFARLPAAAARALPSMTEMYL